MADLESFKSQEIIPTDTEFTETNDILGNDDEKKFKELIGDSDVSSAMQKVADKCCTWTFGEDFRELAALDSAGQLQPMVDNILDKYPGISRYMASLGLPIGNVDFLLLSTQQKLNYMGLVRVFSVKNAAKGLNKLAGLKVPDSVDNIINNHKILMASYETRIQGKLKRKNLTNFNMLGTTLKSDFGLTDDECVKFSEYLLLVKKHPEFVGNMKVIEAGNTGGYIVVAVLASALTALGMYSVSNIWKKNENIETGPNITVYNEPKEIARLLTAEQGFSISEERTIEKCSITDGPLSDINPANWVRKTLNKMSYIRINMNLTGKKCLEFDLEGSTLTLDRDKKEIIFEVKQPKIFLRDEKTVVNGDSGIISSKRFIGEESKLREDLEKQELNNPHNIKLYNFGLLAAESKILDIANLFNGGILPEGEKVFEKCTIKIIPEIIPTNLEKKYETTGVNEHEQQELGNQNKSGNSYTAIRRPGRQ